ncbi:MAG: hypothetical protein R3E66_15500 [bacterium]
MFSNDASLLLPTATLGTDYYVVDWPTQPLPLLVHAMSSGSTATSIVAVESGDTFINVTATATITAGA